MQLMYSELDAERPFSEASDKALEPFRSAWRRDYARLIHSPCFRRLQGKTQVFPGHESDFYRNRLTHSLEVAQIAKSIAVRLNSKHAAFRSKTLKIEPDIVEFAGLAHDLGHPPFGHNGEEALDECMSEHGGFEGNAQSLRIVSKLEKKICGPDQSYGSRFGLNLSYRSLASLLKYDCPIPERSGDRTSVGVQKGYYAEDLDLIQTIKTKVLKTSDYNGKFKTIECSIMDVADDIAYSTYDMEDIFKAGFLSPMDLFSLKEEVYEAVAKTIRGRIVKQYPDYSHLTDEIDSELVEAVLFLVFEEMIFGTDRELVVKAEKLNSADRGIIAGEIQALSKKLAEDGYSRTRFTSKLVQKFLSGIQVIKNDSYPQLHNVRLDFDTFIFVEVSKNITYHVIIRSSFLQVVEYRGKDIVKKIFEALKDDGGTRLLPSDFQALCKDASEMQRMRCICDFIAGMTDRYAFEFYDRLFGSARLTIHKPL